MSDHFCVGLFYRILNLLRDRGNFSWLRNYSWIRPVFTDCCDARELDHATLMRQTYKLLCWCNWRGKMKLSVESGRTNRNRDHTRTCLKRNWASSEEKKKATVWRRKNFTNEYDASIRPNKVHNNRQQAIPVKCHREVNLLFTFIIGGRDYQHPNFSTPWALELARNVSAVSSSRFLEQSMIRI